MTESLELTPDTVEFLPEEKNYLSVDELREDILDISVPLDCVSWRGRPCWILRSDTHKARVAHVDILINVAASMIVRYRIAGYMNRAYPGGESDGGLFR